MAKKFFTKGGAGRVQLQQTSSMNLRNAPGLYRKTVRKTEVGQAKSPMTKSGRISHGTKSYSKHAVKSAMHDRQNEGY